MAKSPVWRGKRLYAIVIAQIFAEPRPAWDIAERIGVKCESDVRKTLYQLSNRGLARIVGWRPREGHGGPPLALWAFGGGEWAAYPENYPKSRISSRTSKRHRPGIEMIAFSMMLDSLMAGATMLEISEDSGIPQHAASKLIAFMRKHGLCHCCDWVRRVGHGGTPARVWKFGPGADKRRPVPGQSKAPDANKAHRLQRERAKNLARRLTVGAAHAAGQV
jgi:hypothetical protein